MQTSSPEPGWGLLDCHRVSSPGWDVVSQLWRESRVMGQEGGDLLWQYHEARPFKDLPLCLHGKADNSSLDLSGS